MKSLCIDMETLAAYIGGSLSIEDREQMEKHLSVCDDCRKDFVIANILLKDRKLSGKPVSQEKARSVWHNIKEKITTTCEWTRAAISDPTLQRCFSFFGAALSPARESGPASSVDYIQQARIIGDMEAEMYIQKTGNNIASLKLRIHKESEKPANIRVTLRREGKLVKSIPLTGDYTAFESLSFGNYCLILGQDGEEKGDCFFEISEKGLTLR